MAKPFELTERAIILVSSLLIMGGILFAVLAYYFIRQPPSFTGYEPTVKLNGLSVEKAELAFENVDNFVKTGIDYRQMYSSGVTLYEHELFKDNVTGGSWVTCEQRQRRLSDSRDSLDCKESAIGNGGRYSVSVTRRDGKVIDIWVVAEIGETGLWVRIPEEKQWEEFARYDGWQTYFDSMKPKSLLFTPYVYRPSPLRSG